MQLLDSNNKVFIESSTHVNILKFSKIENIKADNLTVLQTAIDYCAENHKTLVLNKAVYYYDGVLKIKCNIEGNGASFARYNYGQNMDSASEFSILFKEISDLVITDLHLSDEKNNYDTDDYKSSGGYRSKFSFSDNYESFGKIGFISTSNIKIENCIFDGKMPDLYNDCHYITFNNTIFKDIYDKSAGGIWVRASSKQTDNIKFTNCQFYKASADEMIAVWGWCSKVMNILVDSCYFQLNESSNYICHHFITMCQSGDMDNFKINNCTFDMNYVNSSIFRFAGSNTSTNKNGSITNCTINIKNYTGENQTAIAMTAADDGSVFNNLIFENNTVNILDATMGTNNNWFVTKHTLVRNNVFNISADFNGSGSFLFGGDCPEISGNSIFSDGKIRVAQNFTNFSNNIIKTVAGSTAMFQMMKPKDMKFIGNKISVTGTDTDARFFFNTTEENTGLFTITDNIVEGMKMYLVGVENVKFINNIWNGSSFTLTAKNLERYSNIVNSKKDASITDLQEEKINEIISDYIENSSDELGDELISEYINNNATDTVDYFIMKDSSTGKNYKFMITDGSIVIEEV